MSVENDKIKNNLNIDLSVWCTRFENYLLIDVGDLVTLNS